MKFLYRLTLVLALLAAEAASASDINQGGDIYRRHCAMCHGATGKPSMAGAADFSRGQGLMQSEQSLQERISRGKNACPAFRGILREQQILDVIAYIRTLF